MRRIVICYNVEAKSCVEELREDLDAANDCVPIEFDAQGTQRAWTTVLSCIRECDLFLYFKDPSSGDCRACQAQLNYARAVGKTILTVVDGGNLEYIDLSGIPYRGGSKISTSRLLAEIEKASPSRRLPDPLPAPPPDPMHFPRPVPRTSGTEDQHAEVVPAGARPGPVTPPISRSAIPTSPRFLEGQPSGGAATRCARRRKGGRSWWTRILPRASSRVRTRHGGFDHLDAVLPKPKKQPTGSCLGVLVSLALYAVVLSVSVLGLTQTDSVSKFLADHGVTLGGLRVQWGAIDAFLSRCGIEFRSAHAYIGLAVAGLGILFGRTIPRTVLLLVVGAACLYSVDAGYFDMLLTRLGVSP